MKRSYLLTPAQPSLSAGTQFEPAWCSVSNPTGSPIVVRVGSPEIPTLSNADQTVPAGGTLTFAVAGREFGFAYADATLLAQRAAGNVNNRALVQFGTSDETPPTYGGANFQSLSLSEATSGLAAFTGVTTLPTFDLGAWGGLLISVIPNALSGQGVIAVNVSSDGLAFRNLENYAFWPNIPVILTVPRVARFVQIILNQTAIVGEPAIGGFVSARFTLSEVQAFTYAPLGNALTRTVAIAANGSQQFTFVTTGLPAVSIAAISTVGSAAGTALTFLVEASSDNNQWRKVTDRTQRFSQGITLYRAMGNLDLFIRVTIFEVSGANPLNATLYVSVPPAPDLGYILNVIQQSLGDNGAPLNTNQDIYHELDSIRGSLATYQPQLNELPTMRASLSSIQSSNTDIDAKIVSIESRLGQGAVCYFGSGAVPNVNTWFGTGVAINPFYKVAAITFGFTGLSGTLTGTPIIGLGQGTSGAMTQQWYICPPVFVQGAGSGTIGTAYAPPMMAASIGGPGILIFSNSSQLWMYNGAFNTLPTWVLSVWAYPQ
jgi:hypothetical protein